MKKYITFPNVVGAIFAIALLVAATPRVQSLFSVQPDVILAPGDQVTVICEPGSRMTGPRTARLLKCPTLTPAAVTATPPRTATQPVTATSTKTATVGVTNTSVVTKSATAPVSPSPTTQGGNIAPFVGAPLCPDSGTSHDNSLFHTLWDSSRGCHYDHEHGQSPFTPQVAAMFPGFNLFSLLGNVGVGHTNPSSDMENTHKHGGNKWNVQLIHPEGCTGFTGAPTGVNGSVIQFHGFGDYAIEAEVRIHSSLAMLRQCKSSNPNDFGYVFINQLQDYGQRITPYQGVILPYPNQPDPAFPSPRAPYLSFDCDDRIPPSVPQCASASAGSNWQSEVDAGHSDTPELFRLLWRVGDNYQAFDWNDQTYPFHFFWLCTSDGGATYNPAGCRKNNTTTQVHEIRGVIPASWDNQPFDTDPRTGRITFSGFVDGAGNRAPSCTVAGGNCYPIKLVNAFTGTYGSVLIFTTGKGTNIFPSNPSRNIYFCGTQACSETSPGAVPSGWVGPSN